jgi:hypothetical protein
MSFKKEFLMYASALGILAFPYLGCKEKSHHGMAPVAAQEPEQIIEPTARIEDVVNRLIEAVDDGANRPVIVHGELINMPYEERVYQTDLANEVQTWLTRRYTETISGQYPGLVDIISSTDIGRIGRNQPIIAVGNPQYNPVVRAIRSNLSDRHRELSPDPNTGRIEGYSFDNVTLYMPDQNLELERVPAIVLTASDPRALFPTCYGLTQTQTYNISWGEAKILDIKQVSGGGYSTAPGTGYVATQQD